MSCGSSSAEALRSAAYLPARGVTTPRRAAEMYGHSAKRKQEPRRRIALAYTHAHQPELIIKTVRIYLNTEAAA